MARLNKEQLDIIKQKLGVNVLWSYSKLSTFTQCSNLYKLKYIDKIRVKSDSCYTYWGTVAHELIQDFYEGAITHDEMMDKFETKKIEYLTLDDEKLKFPTEDQFNKYIECLQLYFENATMLTDYKVFNERAILTELESNKTGNKYVFHGYIDSELLDKDNKLIILDFKTSSVSGFSGKQLHDKAKQLMIYAIGTLQHGRMVKNTQIKFNINDITIRYDMMKYNNISFMQANGNLKTTKAERNSWVAKMSNQIRKDLENVSRDIAKIDKEIAKLERKHNAKVRTEEERVEIRAEINNLIEHKESLQRYNHDPLVINEMIEIAIIANNLDNMPKFIQDKYTIENCYIDIQLTNEDVEGFKTELVNILDGIVEKELSEDVETAFSRGKIDQGDSFFCVNLCDMKDYCNYYKEYKEHQSMFIDQEKDGVSDDEILKMLGLK